MQFRSDNTGPAHPKVLEAILAANAGYTAPYGDETAMEAVRARLREIFEAPEAAVYLVATGTAANALLLSTMTQPWQRVFCGTLSHVLIDECGAVEHATGGARLEPVAGPDAKIGIAEFEAALAAVDPADIHMTQRGPVTITQVTERGTLYTLDEIRAIANLAHAHGSGVHMDGARFANALVALGCTPAEMTWKAGVDAVSFGATKNGCLGVEAAILFNPAKAREFELRRKRAAHLFSKHRYLSAQMAAYLQDDLWLDLARQSNAAGQGLARGLRQIPGVTLDYDPAANMLFPRWPRVAHRRLLDAGAAYYPWGDVATGPDDEAVPTRLVCDWSADEGATTRFLDTLRATAA